MIIFPLLFKKKLNFNGKALSESSFIAFSILLYSYYIELFT